MAAPSLRVQTVLYRNDPSQLERFSSGLGVAAARAREAGALGEVSFAVGDCSEDPVVTDAAALAARHAGALRADGTLDYVHFGENLGSAGGHNRLFADLGPDTDFVLVANADTYASPDLLVELISACSQPGVGIAEGRQVPVEQPKVHDAATGDTSWASGSCLLARAEVVRTTGGFDPDLFFLYCDDVDFSWRTRLAGWRVVHRPTAAVFHDKRLVRNGDLEVSDTELVYGAEASVLLPLHYSRPDVAQRNRALIEASSDERHRQAIARLLSREQAGAMPEPLDPEGKVAQFVEPYFDYAVHRFSWAWPAEGEIPVTAQIAEGGADG